MRGMMKRSRKRLNRGQGLVEFALILPVLLFIVFGIIDFGRVMVIYAGVSNGAREAVRYGAVPGRRSDAKYNYQDCDVMANLARSAVPLMELTDDQIWLGFDNGSGAPDAPTYLCGAPLRDQIQQGDRIVARVDLKSDRKRSRLLVQGAFVEASAAADDIAGPLLEELTLMARWLGLVDLEIAGRGDLAPDLRRG